MRLQDDHLTDPEKAWQTKKLAQQPLLSTFIPADGAPTINNEEGANQSFEL
jgi:hypothetical protein